MADDLLPEGMPTVGSAMFDADTPMPAPAPTQTVVGGGGGGGFPSNLAPLGNYWADYYGLDRNIFASMIHHESGFDHNLSGGSGELGLGQLMPGTARGLGLVVNNNVDERTDPNKNLMASAKYLRQQLDDPRVNGNYPKALMLYNSGPNPKVPFTNTDYANAVMGGAGAGAPIQLVSASSASSGTGPYLSGDPVADSPYAVGGTLAFVPPKPAVQFTGPNAPMAPGSGGSGGSGGPVVPVGGAQAGAGGPSGEPSGAAQSDRARAISDAFKSAGGQGRGFQMLALMSAMLRGWPVRQAYPIDPRSLVPSHLPGTGDAPMGIGLGANTERLGMMPWEQFAYRRRDVPR